MKPLAAALVVLALLAFGPRTAAGQPYAPELELLSEIIGGLQFLSELCDLDEIDWRGQMTALLESTGADEPARLRMTDRYNLGYSAFATTYRDCTPAALEAVARYRAIGASLVAAIAEAFPLPSAPIDPDG